MAGARLQAYEALDGDAWDPTFAWTSGVLTTVGAELEENLLATHRSWDDEGTVLAFDHVRERAESPIGASLSGNLENLMALGLRTDVRVVDVDGMTLTVSPEPPVGLDAKGT